VRDIGMVVWIVLLIVGVIGSMVSSLRKQAQLRQAPASRLRQVPRPSPAVMTPPPAPVVAPAAAPRRSSPPGSIEPPPEPPRRPRRFFGDRRALVQAVLAAEVLGKPLALRDE